MEDFDFHKGKREKEREAREKTTAEFIGAMCCNSISSKDDLYSIHQRWTQTDQKYCFRFHLTLSVNWVAWEAVGFPDWVSFAPNLTRWRRMDSKAINDIFIWDTLDEISCCKLMSTTWTPLLHKSFCSQISNIVSDEICGLHELP